MLPFQTEGDLKGQNCPQTMPEERERTVQKWQDASHRGVGERAQGVDRLFA